MQERSVSFGYRISQLHRLIARCIRRSMLPLGIEQGQVPFLAELFCEEGITQDDLSTRLHIDKGVTARQLARIEKAGLIERRTNAGNKRQKMVYLTPAMRMKCDDFRAPLRQLSEELVAGFTDTERQMALDLLDRMTQNLLTQIASGEDS